MSIEVWVLVVAIVAALAAIASAVLTGIELRFTRRGLDKQEEQLRLQRELASMIPELEVLGIGFSAARCFAEVSDTLRERDEAIRKEQEESQRAAERRQREEQRREAERRLREDPNNLRVLGDLIGLGSQTLYDSLDVQQPFDFRASDPDTLEQRDYRGPEPDAVMQIVLKNVGRTAANDITGTITTNANHVKMLNFPGLDAESVSQPDDRNNHTAELGTISELLPGRSDVFKLGIVVCAEDEDELKQLSLRYDFITPSGHGASGTWALDSEDSPTHR